MKTSLIFLAKSIGRSTRCGRKSVTLAQAARHNLRELQAERGSRAHISTAHTALNCVLHGPAESGAMLALASGLMQRYQVPRCKLRRDHVQALEFVISLPASSTVDPLLYFKASTDWLLKTFGSEMLLSVVVHFDEAAPHMHALVLPIIQGVYQGGAPINRTNLPKLVSGFAESVGRPFGLSFEPKLRLTASQRGSAVNVVIDHLSTYADPVLRSCLWPAICSEIKRSPQTYLYLLGLTMPSEKGSKPIKTMAQIMTSKGKQTVEDRRVSKSVVHPSVGFRKSTTPNPPADPGTKEPRK